MVGLIVAFLALALGALSEWIHARRVLRVTHLAFGEKGARSWTRVVPLVRSVAVAASAWGLVTLLQLDAAPFEPDSRDDARAIRHLVIVLDVSPSMQLADAGPQGTQTRDDRARDVLRTLLTQLDARRTLVSVIAFYSTARPVVIDTFDPEVTANILGDLPLTHAFTAGQTDLYAGIKACAEPAKVWREGSATLVVISDGDTLPTSDTPMVPPAYSSVLILGVGSTDRGVFIDDHNSRQDSTSLERLALKLGGKYHDVNRRHLSSTTVLGATGSSLPETKFDFDRRRLALAAVSLGAASLSLLPMALAYGGAKRRAPDRRRARPQAVLAGG